MSNCDPMDCSTPDFLVLHYLLSSLKLMSIESVMPSNHLVLWCLRLLLPSMFPSIRVTSKESALGIRWPKYWSFSFSISPSNEYLGLIWLVKRIVFFSGSVGGDGELLLAMFEFTWLCIFGELSVKYQCIILRHDPLSQKCIWPCPQFLTGRTGSELSENLLPSL